jgi:hypothetical protein
MRLMFAIVALFGILMPTLRGGSKAPAPPVQAACDSGGTMDPDGLCRH